MSVAGIAGSSLSNLSSIQRNYQQVQGQFKQLGQDLQSGNLTQAQTDFVSLSQSVSSQLSTGSPLGKALSSIGQALQSGNLSAAQQAFASLSNATGAAAHHHGHARPAAVQSAFDQSLSQLGDALQSGNLTAAQQAFSAVQQVWQQMSAGAATTASNSAGVSTSSGVSLTA